MRIIGNINDSGVNRPAEENTGETVTSVVFDGGAEKWIFYEGDEPVIRDVSTE